MGGANTQSQEWKPNPNDLRADGSLKGKGFLGVMSRIDNPKKVSSEISIGVDWGSGEKQIPTIVPTLDNNEIKYLLSTPEDKIFTSNPELGRKIEQKAVRFAREREQKGLPFFAQENEFPKQQTNIMGGSNTQTPQPPQENPVKEAKTYARLEKQGMSGSGDESLASYVAMGKDIYGDLRAQASKMISPNLFGRDVSAPATQETPNK
jgi:hypothetical protein